MNKIQDLELTLSTLLDSTEKVDYNPELSPDFDVRISNGDVRVTGKWFQMVEIKQQLVKERYTDFDSGWSYQSFWKTWKEKWMFDSLCNQ